MSREPLGAEQLFALPSLPFDDMNWQRLPCLRWTETVTRDTAPLPEAPQPRSLDLPRTVRLPWAERPALVLMRVLGLLLSVQLPPVGAGAD